MKLCLVAILILLSQLCFAQTELSSLVQEVSPSIQLSKAELNILNQELKLQTLIIESIKELELDGVEFKNISKVQSSVEDLISNATKLKALDLGYQLKESTTSVITDSIEVGNFKNKLSNLKKFVSNDLVIKKRAISAITRRFGMEVGIFYLVAAQVDYTIPLLLIGTGNVPLGAALFSTPFSSTSTSLFISLKKAVKKLHLMKKLGFKKFKDHLLLTKKLKKHLNRNLFKTDYLHSTTIRNTNYLFTIEDSNIFKRLLNKMGYNNKVLNYENFVKFLRQEDILIHKLNQIDSSKTPRMIKMLELIKEIEQNGSPDIITKMQSRFSKSINLLKGPNLSNKNMQWFIKTGNVKSFDDLFRALKNIPTDLPPRVFGNAWRNYLLPQLAKSITDDSAIGSYRSFRKLHELYDKELKPLIVINKQKEFSGNIKGKFVDYLYSSTVAINSCGQIYKMKKGSTAPLL